jgi:hypothetical protein
MPESTHDLLSGSAASRLRFSDRAAMDMTVSHAKQLCHGVRGFEPLRAIRFER